MSSLFSAFDCNFYERIIPYHLANIELFPPEVLKHLKSGSFTVSVTGQRWCTVALDEAHEICINKDLKAAVIHPTKSYIPTENITLFNYCIKAYKNIIHELFPERDTQRTTCTGAALTVQQVRPKPDHFYILYIVKIVIYAIVINQTATH